MRNCCKYRENGNEYIGDDDRGLMHVGVWTIIIMIILNRLLRIFQSNVFYFQIHCVTMSIVLYLQDSDIENRTSNLFSLHK